MTPTPESSEQLFATWWYNEGLSYFPNDKHLKPEMKTVFIAACAHYQPIVQKLEKDNAKLKETIELQKLTWPKLT